MDRGDFMFFPKVLQSVISGRSEGDNERVCAVEFRFLLKALRLHWESNPGPVD